MVLEVNSSLHLGFLGFWFPKAWIVATPRFMDIDASPIVAPSTLIHQTGGLADEIDARAAAFGN